MDKNCKGYFVEEDNNEYYVYNDDDELVYIASSIESLNDFCPGLGDLQESFMITEEKDEPQEKKRGWDPDEHLKKVVKYYKDWAGFNEDEVLTEDLLKNEDWRLKRVSSLKNVPVKQLKAELLKQKDSE
jgi:hypothetical protein